MNQKYNKFDANINLFMLTGLKKYFLKLNTGGTPISKEHLYNVRLMLDKYQGRLLK